MKRWGRYAKEEYTPDSDSDSQPVGSGWVRCRNVARLEARRGEAKLASGFSSHSLPVSCFVVSCGAMSCRVVSCHVMSCTPDRRPRRPVSAEGALLG